CFLFYSPHPRHPRSPPFPYTTLFRSPIIRTRLAQTFRYIVSQRLIPRADLRGRIAAVEILRSTPRTREYIESGEMEGKSLLDAMRDGKLDGMQHFDDEIKDLVERNIVSIEDGLGFATN